MATVIGSTIAGTISQPTGLAFQRHLVWAANDSAWWLFYLTSTAGSQISSYRSPDGVTWTSKTATGAMLTSHTLNSDGRNFGVAYKNISSNDVIHCPTLGTNGANADQEHIRATLSSDATWSAWGTVQGDQASITGYSPAGCGAVLDSNNRPCATYEDTNVGNPNGVRATNTDLGSSWTAGWGSGTQLDTVNNECNAQLIFDLGSGNLLELWENGANGEPNSMDNVRWSKWNGTSWSAGANVFTAFTTQAPNNFGAVDLSTSDIHCVVRTGSNTYTHKRFNGTSWIAGDTIPNQTSTADQGVVLATDNSTQVWMFIINSTSLLYIKWTSGSGWDANWTTLETESGTPTFLTGWPYVVSNTIGLAFTQQNGSNFDVYFTSLSLVAAATPYIPGFLTIAYGNLVPLVFIQPFGGVAMQGMPVA